MKKTLITTADGSHSLFVPELNENYHSTHGAIKEAMHVFIRNGLQAHIKQKLNILEIGFGTGLNALLTFENTEGKQLNYITLEPLPICEEIYKKLNFYKFMKSNQSIFNKLHECEWNKDIKLNNYFTLHKKNVRVKQFSTKKKFDIIYFDAFAPEKQQEMWEKLVFQKCYNLLNQNGSLVTYCAKGVVKRTIKSVGFELETLTGPPGKREMIRANKR